jgi:hypothetical protein
MVKVMFRQLKSLIKACNVALLTSDETLKPFKANLLPLFRSIKEKTG